MKTIVLQNGDLRAEITSQGASIHRLFYRDLEVGKDGITVGRYANRIYKGHLCIDGLEYQLDTNENGHCLHGGTDGFDKKLWDIVSSNDSSAELCMTSPDKDMGFPGEMKVCVNYALLNNSIHIKYEASSDKDTVINLTNHTYFNLNGRGNADGHILQINAELWTETDDELIPTGALLPVDGTFYDYRSEQPFRPDIDINYVLKGDEFKKAASLYGTLSGVCMAVYTDQPGMQVYNTKTHICLETQHFPDSPNHPDFPSVLLKAGDIFRSETVYAFSKIESR